MYLADAADGYTGYTHTLPEPDSPAGARYNMHQACTQATKT